MRNVKFKLFITLIFMLTLVGGVQAQTTQQTAKPAPLMIGIGSPDGGGDGDVYQYSGGLVRRTNWGHNRYPVASLTGNWVAYNSVAEFYIKQAVKNPDLSAPMNTYILEVATGKSRRLSVQPANASLAVNAEVYTLRSTPSWSPDGRTLAWTEITMDRANGINTDGTVEQLVIYDVNTDVQRVIVDKLPEHTTVNTNPVLSEVAWGYPGIAVVTHQPGEAGSDLISIYSETGTLISQTEPLPSFGSSQVVWITDDGVDFLAPITGEFMIDPASGEQVALDGTPEVYNPNYPDGVSMFFGDKTVGEGNPVWLLAINGIPKVELAASGRYYNESGIAISEDGKQVAYIIYPGQGTAGGVYLYSNGRSQQILSSKSYNATGLAWGPIAWRVRHTEDTPEP